MSLFTNNRLPRISATTSNNVTAAERTSAIDFVNRVNFLFEEFDHEKMLSAFLPDAVAYHFHGTIRGHAEMRKFFAEDYPYLIEGVTRHATNHIVDRDGEDGVLVKYHEQLIRHAWPAKGGKVESGAEKAGPALKHEDGLPALWLWSHMVDRLRKDEDGEWKIAERYLGAAAFNTKLDPPTEAK
jgi:ketosteroid isomerase-like protein